MSSTTSDAGLYPRIGELRTNLNSVIRGKDEIVENVILALIAGGSLLIEDVPGVGKTTLAKSLAASISLDFNRLQCTPDLLPADVFGFPVFNPQDGTFAFRRGPVFTNILLVDEINRASPRTQSALLESMAEKQVTVDGTRYDLDKPFMVIATQNPLGFQGTFPLPEAQLDRFLLRLSLDYPDAESETDILFDQLTAHPMENIQPVLSSEVVSECQAMVRQVSIQRRVARYMVEIVRQTRLDQRVRFGCSPRGLLMLCRAAQAQAFLKQRDYVLPDDVQQVAVMVLAHRLSLASGSQAASTLQEEIIRDQVSRVDVPL